MFDEMANSTSLFSNMKCDFIEGFKYIDEPERQSKFVNHALVFKARGKRRKWKQPLAFYFMESTAKRGDFMILIICPIRFKTIIFRYY
jgi:hypothetical protein